MKDEKKASAVAFLRAAGAYYASLGLTIERVNDRRWRFLQIFRHPQGL
jgi:hypothetical protein